MIARCEPEGARTRFRTVRLTRMATVLVGASTLALAAAAGAQVPVARSMNPESQDETDTVWTIESGSYAGLRVPLHIDAALGPGGRGEHFWRVATGGELSGGVVGWKSTRYPIPLAFRHDRFSRAISPGDSAAFWAILGDMSRDFGMELFRPATVARDDPPDIIVVDLGGMRNVDGLSRVSWTQSGELSDVRVTFNDAAVLHDPHVVAHEMMHALGFGHTTAWRSIVSPRDASGAVRVTPEDVAYAELAMHSRVSRERVDTRRLIALAVARESRFNRDGDYARCEADLENAFSIEVPTRTRGYMPMGLLTVVPTCAQ
jgi:hypothetical protein